MAIPISDDLKQIQAPRTANLAAPDAASNSKLFLQGQQQLSSALGQMGEAAIGAGQRYERTQEAFKRNEAERIYNREFTYWNEWLKEKQGWERIEAQKKYEAEMNRAKDEYEARINKVRDFEMREGSKRSINQLNTSNAANYQYDNYKNETQMHKQSMEQSVLDSYRNSLAQVNNLTDIKQANIILVPALESATEKIKDFYYNRMGFSDEMVAEYVRDARGKMVIGMANRIMQQTKQLGGGSGYEVSHKLIEQGIKSKDINYEVGVEALREIETEYIKAVAIDNPEKLADSNGNFSFDKARPLAKNLAENELRQTFNSAKNSNSGYSAEQRQMAEEVSTEAVDKFFNEAYKRFSHFLDAKDVIRLSGQNQKQAEEKIKGDKEYWAGGWFRFAADPNEYVTELLSLYNQAESLYNLQIDAEDGTPYETKDQREFAAKNKRRLMTMPAAQRKQLRQFMNNVAFSISNSYNPKNGYFTFNDNTLSEMRLDKKNTLMLNAIHTELKKSANKRGDGGVYIDSYDLSTAVSNANLAMSLAASLTKHKDGMAVDLSKKDRDFSKDGEDTVYFLDKDGKVDIESGAVSFTNLTAMLFANYQLGANGEIGNESFEKANNAGKVAFVKEFGKELEATEETERMYSEYSQEKTLESNIAAMYILRNPTAQARETAAKMQQDVLKVLNDPKHKEQKKKEFEEEIQQRKSAAAVNKAYEQNSKLLVNIQSIEMNSADALVDAKMFDTEDEAVIAKGRAARIRNALKDIYMLGSKGNDLSDSSTAVIKVNNSDDISALAVSANFKQGLVEKQGQPIQNMKDIVSRALKINKNKSDNFIATDIGMGRIYVFAKQADNSYKFLDFIEAENAEQFYSFLMLNKDIQKSLGFNKYNNNLITGGRFVTGTSADTQAALSRQRLNKTGAYGPNGVLLYREQDSDFPLQ